MVLVSVDYYPELDIAGGTAPLKVGATEFKVTSPTYRRNEIDSQEWEKIKNHPAIALRIDKGILRLIGGGQPIITSAQFTSSQRATLSEPLIQKEESQTQPSLDISSSVQTPLFSQETPTEKEPRTRKPRSVTTNDSPESTNS